MFQLIEPVAESAANAPVRRNPAIVVTLAFASGIWLDHVAPGTFLTWWALSATAIVLQLVLWSLRWRSLSAAALILACIGIGASWHHWRWDCSADNHIRNWITEQGGIVRLESRVIQPPLVLKLTDSSRPWLPPERTIVLVECRHLIDAATDVPTVGQVRLSVAGNQSDLKPGDVVQVIGKLMRPQEPANPGQFDRRTWLRAQGVHALLSADSPAAVTVTGYEPTVADRLISFRWSVRQRAETLISSRMRPRTSAVAQSLLLGSRLDVDEDLKRSFAESGMLHVLAISGMNVGLLWQLVWVICRILRISPRASLIAVMILLPVYALITDANPPVVRATIVAVVMAFGQLSNRVGGAWNSLALAAILILAWNPSDLFNAGAQLSFAAVCAILWSMSFLRTIRVTRESDEGPIAGPSIAIRAVRAAAPFAIETVATSLIVWWTTSPLIASQFHVVSPIGFLVNVVLSIPIVLMFWLGYLFLLLGMISPVLFGWLAVPFDALLGWFLSAVELSARFDLGHSYVPSPAAWWLWGFYLILGSLALVDRYRGRVFWSIRGVLAWTVLGLGCAAWKTGPSDLTCTVLSVSHGLSVLVELPNGRTLLYDAGSMNGGEVVARTIEGAAWTSGRSRLDAIVVSHADADHCNGLPNIVEVMPTRSLLVHRTFLDWSQPPVAAALEKASRAGIAITTIAAGQQIELDRDVTITILHPDVQFRGKADNANSLVLSIEYRGRRILLTGDLEREGLQKLLASEPMDTDVLLSPHHGSAAANGTDMARWSRPEWLIASCRDDKVRDRLEANFGPGTHVLTTARDGAVRCRITANGDLNVEPFKRRD